VNLDGLLDNGPDLRLSAADFLPYAPRQGLRPLCAACAADDCCSVYIGPADHRIVRAAAAVAYGPAAVVVLPP